MPLLIALVLAVIVVAFVARRNKLTKSCRWRADKTGDRGSLRKYTCAACGAEAFTATSGPPKDCKRSVAKGGL